MQYAKTPYFNPKNKTLNLKNLLRAPYEQKHLRNFTYFSTHTQR